MLWSIERAWRCDLTWHMKHKQKHIKRKKRFECERSPYPVMEKQLWSIAEATGGVRAAATGRGSGKWSASRRLKARERGPTIIIMCVRACCRRTSACPRRCAALLPRVHEGWRAAPAPRAGRLSGSTNWLTAWRAKTGRTSQTARPASLRCRNSHTQSVCLTRTHVLSSRWLSLSVLPHL